MLRSILISTALFCALPALSVAQQNDSILNDNYVTTREYVEAEVLRINSRERTITVRGANRGENRTFTVAEDSRITVNGRPARLRDIFRGDEVRLAMRVRADEEVIIGALGVPDTSITLETRQETPVEQRTVTAPTQPAQPVVAEVRPSVLPSTGSALPLLLVTGMLALLAAVVLRKRQSQ